MKEVKCSNCGRINSNAAKFCKGCGKKLEKIKEFCTECVEELVSDALFCTKCETKRESEILSKKETKGISWNFNSKTITICFLICAVLVTYIFSSQEFISEFLQVENGRIFGVIFGIIGLILLFVVKRKEKINLKKDLKQLKHLKLTKNITGLIFLLSGLIVLLNIGPTISDYSLILIYSILGMCATILFCKIIYLNYRKLEGKVSVVNQTITLLCSITLSIGFISLYSHGDEVNSNFSNQFESFMKYGRTNPGNEYITYALYCLIAAIVFLILFFLLRTNKAIAKKSLNKFVIGVYIFILNMAIPFLFLLFVETL